MTTAIVVIISILIICATVIAYKYLEEYSVHVNRYVLEDIQNKTDDLRKQMDCALQELDEIQEQLKEKNLEDFAKYLEENNL